MISAFDYFHEAFVMAHGGLHPPHSILGNSLILVTVPNADSVGIGSIREAPWLAIVIQDLYEIPMRALGRFCM